MDQAESRGNDRQWFIVQRWQEYDGERRANLLRIAAIGAFYGIHLLHYYQADPAALEMSGAASAEAFREFHLSVTALAVAWTMMAIGVLLCLGLQIFPPWLKFVSTGGDVLLLTSILYVADGPRSPLVVGYFLVLALAALRFSLPLVRCATFASMLGYAALLCCARWPERFGKGDVDIRVPRYEQLMTLLAIGLTGVMLGQLVRRARAAAEEFAARVGAESRR